MESNDFNVILYFLSDSFEIGKARTMSVYRSVLFSNLQRVDGVANGQHPLVMGLMTRYESTWDVDEVLDYL